jgi:hypothetical protein
MLKLWIEICLFLQVNCDSTKSLSRNSELFNNMACGSSTLNFTEVRPKYEENADISFMPFRKTRFLLHQFLRNALVPNEIICTSLVLILT